MTARAALKQAIAPHAPATWEIYDYPTRLRTFDDPAKPVAIVIEQRGLKLGRFSADENGTPIDVELMVWVVVDAARGDDLDVIENDLEAAAEHMLRILEDLGLPDHVWDGTANREDYDDQKPAYQIPITAAGALTPEPDDEVDPDPEPTTPEE